MSRTTETLLLAIALFLGLLGGGYTSGYGWRIIQEPIMWALFITAVTSGALVSTWRHRDREPIRERIQER